MPRPAFSLLDRAEEEPGARVQGRGDPGEARACDLYPSPRPRPTRWNGGQSGEIEGGFRRTPPAQVRGLSPSGAGFFPAWVGMDMANPQVRLQVPYPVPKDLAPHLDFLSYPHSRSEREARFCTYKAMSFCGGGELVP